MRAMSAARGSSELPFRRAANPGSVAISGYAQIHGRRRTTPVCRRQHLRGSRPPPASEPRRRRRCNRRRPSTPGPCAHPCRPAPVGAATGPRRAAATAARSLTGSTGRPRRPRALRDPGGDAKSREAAGTAPEGDRVEVAAGRTRLRQQFIHHRQQPLRVPAADQFVPLDQPTYHAEVPLSRPRSRNRSPAVFMLGASGTPSPASASRRRRKAAASARSAAILAGGSAAMNFGP